MLTALLLVLASAAVWCGVYRSLVRHPLDAVALTLYYLALQLIVRPLVLVLGLDTPFPTQLFVGRDVDGLVLGAQGLVVLWLVVLWAGARLLAPVAPALTVLFPRLRRPLPGGVLLVLAVGASALALAVTVLLWSRYGGPTGLIQAAKVDRDLVDSRALRSLPLIAALLGLAAFFTVRRGALLARSAALGCVVLNSGLSFSWGARDVAVLSVVGLVGGGLVYGRAPRGRPARDLLASLRDPSWRRRLVLVAVLAIGAAFALRAARDTLLWGDLAPTLVGEGAVRQLAVATNNTFYDTLLLIVDDWPDEHDLHGSTDFVDAAVASVPTALAGEQEPFVSPAVQVAQTYIDRNNGFPATALGDWYLTYGALGVACGALLSGLLARAAQLAFRDFPRDPLLWALSLVFLVRIFPGGIWVTSLPKWVGIGLPLLVLAVVLDRLPVRRRPPAAVPPVEPPVEPPLPRRAPVAARQP